MDLGVLRVLGGSLSLNVVLLRAWWGAVWHEAPPLVCPAAEAADLRGCRQDVAGLSRWVQLTLYLCALAVAVGVGSCTLLLRQRLAGVGCADEEAERSVAAAGRAVRGGTPALQHAIGWAEPPAARGPLVLQDDFDLGSYVPRGAPGKRCQ